MCSGAASGSDAAASVASATSLPQRSKEDENVKVGEGCCLDFDH